MSKLSGVVFLQALQTLDDVLSVSWLDLVEVSPQGEGIKFFVPDCPKTPSIRTESFRVKLAPCPSPMDRIYNLFRVADLSGFPDCPVVLTAYRGMLYVRPKPCQRQLFHEREAQARDVVRVE